MRANATGRCGRCVGTSLRVLHSVRERTAFSAKPRSGEGAMKRAIAPDALFPKGGGVPDGTVLNLGWDKRKEGRCDVVTPSIFFVALLDLQREVLPRGSGPV